MVMPHSVYPQLMMKKKKKKKREKNLREFNKTQFLISAPGYKITNPKAFKRSDNVQKCLKSQREDAPKN